MRFFADGPAIPNDLLTLRDEGQVVFFCGAGVSLPAGMPTFFGLTKRVMSRLGADESTMAGLMMKSAIDNNDVDLAPPLDQVFSALQREFTAELVDHTVADLLVTPAGADTSTHQIVLQLSTNSDGRPFAVTTNFDLLFERANRRLNRFVPPGLPIMTGGTAHSGVVYLHGRLDRRQIGQRQNFVLGSGDFGRAYLADGWATTFVRQLLEQSVVVLLGYSAGDPPVRYLLEGLSASTSARPKTIYAFERGEPAQVQAKWSDLGVRGIAFGEYDQLWQSLGAWAARARDPDGWTRHVMELASMEPRALAPFERGQVAAMLSSREGAQLFASASTPPSAQWIGVLDRRVRYSQPAGESWRSDARLLDPLVELGLDDDPPRPEADGGQLRVGGLDLIARLPSDDDAPSSSRLADYTPGRSTTPRRLASLSYWFARVAHEPAAVWWAAQQPALHPDVIWNLERRLEGRDGGFTKDLRVIWERLLTPSNTLDTDGEWYAFLRRLTQDGWTGPVTRAFQGVIRPRIVADAGLSRSPVPPSVSASVEEACRFKVVLQSRHGSRVDVPDDDLRAVFSSMREALAITSALLGEIGVRFFHLPAIDPSDRAGRRHLGNNGLDEFFLWTAEILGRCADIYPEWVRNEMTQWPAPDPYIFDKLRIYAWQWPTVASGEIVGTGIGALTQRAFWDGYLQRELLHLIRDRWEDMSDKPQIVARILTGPDRYEGETRKDHRQRRKGIVGERLGWLEQQGCELGKKAKAFLRRTRAEATWKTAYEHNADSDMDGRASWVERRTDPRSLATLPLGDILLRADAESGHRHREFVELAPFAGLVGSNPARALAALALALRRGHFPTKYWTQLLSDWPDNATSRLIWLCARRLIQLPDVVLIELRYYAPRWLDKFLAPLADEDNQGFWCVWNELLAKLSAGDGEATQSSLGEISVGGQPRKTSRKTLDYAINAPVGHLVDAGFNSLGDRTFGKNDGFPALLKSGMANALAAPGEGRDHAVCLLTRRLNWMYYVDPDWVRQAILPLLNADSASAEAAWAGLLFDGQVPQAELFALIKADFLKLFRERAEWLVDDELERQAAQMLVAATWWGEQEATYLSYGECRRALKLLSDSGRQSALWQLGEIITEHKVWSTFGRAFFSACWPQEAKFQTSGATDAMLRIADDNSDQFPQIASAISHHLRPLEYPDMFLFRQSRARRAGKQLGLAERWPREALDVLDKVIESSPRHPPHELNTVLEDIRRASPALAQSRAWKRLRALSA